MTHAEWIALSGYEDIDWPSMLHDRECPACQSEMECPEGEWTRCPNPDCDVELMVTCAGLVRHMTKETK